MTLEAQSLEDLHDVVKVWLRGNPDPSICLLHGEMGSGKTTFVNEICVQLGSKDVTSSPTFSIVNEYVSGQGVSIFHFDLYRIERTEELYDFGFEEYLDRKAYIFIEWPEKGRHFYSEKVRHVRISKKQETRIFSFT